jgi:hypothetical protein
VAKDLKSDIVDLGSAKMLSGTVDPTTGAGVPAPEGSIYLMNAAGAGQLFIKTGAGDTAWTASGGGGASRVAPDANDLLVWSFQEEAGSYVNAGSVGAGGDLGTVGAVVARGAPGLWGEKSAYFPGGALNSLVKGAAGAANRPGGSAFTISGWVYFPVVVAGLDFYVIRYYHSTDSWTSPWYSFSFAIESGDKRFRSVSRFSITDASAKAVSPWELSDGWHHTGVSFDGTELIQYLDGCEVARVTPAGAPDWGTDGSWAFGGNGSLATEHPECGFKDWRVANIARDAAWFSKVWASLNSGS